MTSRLATLEGGLVQGLLISFAGAVVWWVGLAVPGVWWDPCRTCNRELEVIFPLFLGPILATGLSLVLSIGLDFRFARRASPPSRRRVFLTVAAVYALVTGILAAVSRAIYLLALADSAPFLEEWGVLVEFTGLHFAGPLAIAAWALIAGAVHAGRGG